MEIHGARPVVGNGLIYQCFPDVEGSKYALCLNSKSYLFDTYNWTLSLYSHSAGYELATSPG